MPFCHRIGVYIGVHIYTMFPIREKRFDYVEVSRSSRLSEVAKRAGNFAKKTAKNTAKRASGFTTMKWLRKKIKGKKK